MYLHFIQVVVILLISCENSNTSDSTGIDKPCPEEITGIEIGGINLSKPDVKVSPNRLLLLMGGSTENDSAANQFVHAALGGDIITLRTSGSLTSYPIYFMDELIVNTKPSKAITIRTSTPELSNHASVLCRVKQAEAIWLAGGDQWDYIGRWKSELHQLLAQSAEHNIPIGGTSAGSVSLGEAVYDAKNGSITSEEALQNPFHEKLTLSYSTFSQPELIHTIVDSHFKNRDREGRMLTFLARFKLEQKYDSVYGIGLDEKSAIVIRNNQFKVFTDALGSVWIYELSESVSISENVALSLSKVKRIQLSNGAMGTWPINFSITNHDTISVVNGDIQ